MLNVDGEEQTESGLVTVSESNAALDDTTPSYQVSGYQGYQFPTPQQHISGQPFQFYETSASVEEQTAETNMLHQFQTSQV